MKNEKFRKMTLTAFLSAAAYALSLVIVFPNMAPMQHFINVVAAVLLGPWWAFGCAALTGTLRILLAGRPLTALSGAVFGALLSGLFYRRGGTFLWAAAGEVIGTGIVGALVSFPLMKLFYGLPETSAFFYIPFFLPSSATGAALGVLFLGAAQKNTLLRRMLHSHNPLHTRKTL